MRRGQYLLALTLGCGMSLTVFSAMSQAAPSGTITYQGRLVDSNGVPLSGPVVPKLTFRLYRTATPLAAEFVWGEVHENVTVQRGVFTVLLGAGARKIDQNDVVTDGPNPFTSTSFDGPRYLEIEIGDGNRLTPLTPITSVPSAVVSDVSHALVEPTTGAHLDVDALDTRYVRTGGSAIDLSALATRFVDASGDTLTGDLQGTGRWLAAPVDATHGGTGQTSWAAGDLLYASANNQLSRLPKGLDGQVLTLRSGLPVWETPRAKAMRYVVEQTTGINAAHFDIPTGFKPRMVLAAAQAFSGHVSVAVLRDDGTIEQTGFAFDTSGNGGWALRDGALFSFGAPFEWKVTQMNTTQVRITQPANAPFGYIGFLGWVAVVGEE